VFDLLLGQVVTEREAANGLAAAFGVAVSDAIVVRALDGPATAEVGPGIRVLGVLCPVEGSFPLRLRIFMPDADLERDLRRVDPVAIVGRFCAEVGVACFAGDGFARPVAGSCGHGVIDWQLVGG
jgi:hypothetical protein